MKTLLTIKEQKEYLSNNWPSSTFEHKWSCRGMGNSKILNGRGDIIGKASGCGYDRFGAALGDAITKLFPSEILKLAKRECKGQRREYKQSKAFYGLYYNAISGKAWLDGACGSNCMELILKKIGFSLVRVGGTGNNSNTGSEFYTLTPLSKHDRKYY